MPLPRILQDTLSEEQFRSLSPRLQDIISNNASLFRELISRRGLSLELLKQSSVAKISILIRSPNLLKAYGRQSITMADLLQLSAQKLDLFFEVRRTIEWLLEEQVSFPVLARTNYSTLQLLFVKWQAEEVLERTRRAGTKESKEASSEGNDDSSMGTGSRGESDSCISGSGAEGSDGSRGERASKKQFFSLLENKPRLEFLIRQFGFIKLTELADETLAKILVNVELLKTCCSISKISLEACLDQNRFLLEYSTTVNNLFSMGYSFAAIKAQPVEKLTLLSQVDFETVQSILAELVIDSDTLSLLELKTEQLACLTHSTYLATKKMLEHGVKFQEIVNIGADKLAAFQRNYANLERFLTSDPELFRQVLSLSPDQIGNFPSAGSLRLLSFIGVPLQQVFSFNEKALKKLKLYFNALEMLLKQKRALDEFLSLSEDHLSALNQYRRNTEFLLTCGVALEQILAQPAPLIKDRFACMESSIFAWQGLLEEFSFEEIMLLDKAHFNNFILYPEGLQLFKDHRVNLRQVIKIDSAKIHSLITLKGALFSFLKNNGLSFEKMTGFDAEKLACVAISSLAFLINEAKLAVEDIFSFPVDKFKILSKLSISTCRLLMTTYQIAFSDIVQLDSERMAIILSPLYDVCALLKNKVPFEKMTSLSPEVLETLTELNARVFHGLTSAGLTISEMETIPVEKLKCLGENTEGLQILLINGHTLKALLELSLGQLKERLKNPFFTSGYTDVFSEKEQPEQPEQAGGGEAKGEAPPRSFTWIESEGQLFALTHGLTPEEVGELSSVELKWLGGTKTQNTLELLFDKADLSLKQALAWPSKLQSCLCYTSVFKAAMEQGFSLQNLLDLGADKIRKLWEMDASFSVLFSNGCTLEALSRKSLEELNLFRGMYGRIIELAVASKLNINEYLAIGSEKLDFLATNYKSLQLLLDQGIGFLELISLPLQEIKAQVEIIQLAGSIGVPKIAEKAPEVGTAEEVKGEPSDVPSPRAAVGFFLSSSQAPNMAADSSQKNASAQTKPGQQG